MRPHFLHQMSKKHDAFIFFRIEETIMRPHFLHPIIEIRAMITSTDNYFQNVAHLESPVYGILAEGAIALPVTLSGGALFAS